jgi:hypothetical protein
MNLAPEKSLLLVTAGPNCYDTWTMEDIFMRVPRRYLALAALAATPLFAQTQTDYSKIQIKTNKLADNLYTLDGAGGTIGVLTGAEGVFMVDSPSVS